MLSSTGSSKDILNEYHVRPGEQILKCSSRRMLIDHSSKHIKVYESFNRTPEVSSVGDRSFQDTYNGTVKADKYEAHSYYLVKGSRVEVKSEFGAKTGSVLVIKGDVEMNNFKSSSLCSCVLNETGLKVNGSFNASGYDKYFVVFRASATELAYSATISGVRKTYKTDGLKLSCSAEEHFGNCIVNNNGSDEFCSVIDYDAPAGTGQVKVKVLKSNNKIVDGSSGALNSSEEDSSEASKILKVVALVTGILSVVMGIVFAACVYALGHRADRKEREFDREERGSRRSPSSSDAVAISHNEGEDNDPGLKATMKYPAQPPSSAAGALPAPTQYQQPQYQQQPPAAAPTSSLYPSLASDTPPAVAQPMYPVLANDPQPVYPAAPQMGQPYPPPPPATAPYYPAPPQTGQGYPGVPPSYPPSYSPQPYPTAPPPPGSYY